VSVCPSTLVLLFNNAHLWLLTVENLGVAAYLGGAALLSDPRLLVSAGSILTVEARHQTVLNVLSGTGVVVPQAFDVGFTPSEVLAIASQFISGCDLGIPGECLTLFSWSYLANRHLLIQANPTLTLTNTDAVQPGTLLTFSAASINGTIPDTVSNSVSFQISFDAKHNLYRACSAK